MSRAEAIICLSLVAAVVIVLGLAIARPAEASGASRFGISTWYCCTRNYSSSAYIGAAGAPLRVGNWRGRHVRVCRADRPSACVYVALRDFCACRPGVVIDLQPGAFRQLAPLSRGVVRVRVSW